MSEEARHLRARLAVHDLLSDVILVDWLSGLSAHLVDEFLEDYTTQLPLEEREAELRRLARVREKAEDMRRERLMMRVGLLGGTRH